MKELEHLRGWKGSAVELASLLAEIVPRLTLSERPPSVRTLRYWRSAGAIGRSVGRGFAEREALEALSALILRSRGLALDEVGETLKQRTDAELYELVREAAESTPYAVTTGPETGRSRDYAEAAAVLLAQGVLAQYEAVRAGEIVTQGDRVPVVLRDAMRRLGRLYLEQGGEDRAASVHGVIARCRLPLREWRLDAFSYPEFAYSDAVLVDPDLRVPTVECEEIARSLDASGASNVIERQLHDRLREALNALGQDADRAYTSVRKFLGEKSLTTLDELYEHCEKNGLPLRLMELLGKEFYQRVPDAWTIAGRANRCAHCGTLLRPHADTRRYPDGRCPLPACREVNAATLGDRISAEVAMVCRSEILTYWVNPAVDELRIFTAASARGLQCELYPHGDLCDISIGSDVGIDLKAYASPVTLALKMGRDIGGLASYGRRILAIPDYLIKRRPGYLEVLEDSLEGESIASLEVMSVTDVLHFVEEAAGARNT